VRFWRRLKASMLRMDIHENFRLDLTNTSLAEWKVIPAARFLKSVGKARHQRTGGWFSRLLPIGSPKTHRAGQY